MVYEESKKAIIKQRKILNGEFIEEEEVKIDDQKKTKEEESDVDSDILSVYGDNKNQNQPQ